MTRRYVAWSDSALMSRRLQLEEQIAASQRELKDIQDEQVHRVPVVLTDNKPDSRNDNG